MCCVDSERSAASPVAVYVPHPQCVTCVCVRLWRAWRYVSYERDITRAAASPFKVFCENRMRARSRASSRGLRTRRAHGRTAGRGPQAAAAARGVARRGRGPPGPARPLAAHRAHQSPDPRYRPCIGALCNLRVNHRNGWHREGISGFVTGPRSCRRCRPRGLRPPPSRCDPPFRFPAACLSPGVLSPCLHLLPPPRPAVSH